MAGRAAPPDEERRKGEGSGATYCKLAAPRRKRAAAAVPTAGDLGLDPPPAPLPSALPFSESPMAHLGDLPLQTLK